MTCNANRVPESIMHANVKTIATTFQPQAHADTTTQWLEKRAVEVPVGSLCTYCKGMQLGLLQQLDQHDTGNCHSRCSGVQVDRLLPTLVQILCHAAPMVTAAGLEPCQHAAQHCH